MVANKDFGRKHIQLLNQHLTLVVYLYVNILITSGNMVKKLKVLKNDYAFGKNNHVYL